MTQLELPLADAPETRRERLMRVLAGVPEVTTAAKYFTPEEAERSARLATGRPTTTPTTGGAGPF